MTDTTNYQCPDCGEVASSGHDCNEDQLQQMNREAAELEGWTQIKETPIGGFTGISPFSKCDSPIGPIYRGGEGSPIERVPDYAHDLNEMHRLEMGLWKSDEAKYLKYAARVHTIWHEYCPSYQLTATIHAIKMSAPAHIRLQAWLEVKRGRR